MKLLQLFICVVLLKIGKHMGVPVPWYLWIVLVVAYFIDLHSQATLEYNVLTNGKNIHSIGDWFYERFEKGKEESKEVEDEGVLH